MEDSMIMLSTGYVFLFTGILILVSALLWVSCRRIRHFEGLLNRNDFYETKNRRGRELWTSLRDISIEAIVVTLGIGSVLFIGQLIEEQKQEKEDILMQLSSSDKAIASQAAEIAQKNKWVSDGSLKNRDFVLASWEFFNNVYRIEVFPTAWDVANSNFTGANLSFANFRGSNFDGVVFIYSQLFHTDFSGETSFVDALFNLSCMERIILTDAILVGADFEYSDLEGGNLVGADLRGAYMYGANLTNVNLDGAWFDESTLLPDDVYWSEEIDMTKYTDPDHPNYYGGSYPNANPFYPDSDYCSGK